MIVTPSYRRCGNGSELVMCGLRRADTIRVPCALIVSPMGLSLYKNLGFLEMGKSEYELAKFGGPGLYTQVS